MRSQAESITLVLFPIRLGGWLGLRVVRCLRGYYFHSFEFVQELLCILRVRVAGSQDASTAREGVDKNGLGLEQVSGRCSFAERQRVGTRQVQGHSVIRPENAPGGVILFARECDPLVVLAQLDEQAG